MLATHDPIFVRLPNWVGDVIMTLPSLDLIAQQGISIQTVGPKWAQDLLSGTEHTHITIPKNKKDARSFLRKLPGRRMLLLTNSFSSALNAKLNGKAAIGYRTDARRLLLGHSLKKPKNEHEVSIFYKLTEFALAQWGAPIPGERELPKKITLPVADTSLQKIQTLLTDKGIPSQFWVICPFAAGTSKNGLPKTWPYWKDLVIRLKSEGVNTVICPGPGELSLCNEFSGHSYILDGLSLSEYAAVMKLANRVIANDSGPMHVGASVNSPTLGIFGTTDPNRTYPWGGEYIGSANGWPTIDEVLSKVNAN